MENAIIEVKPISTKEVEIRSDEAQNSLVMVQAIKVKTQEDYKNTAGILSEIKGKANELEAERKKITIPIDAAKNAVQALFRKPKEILAEAERIVKGKLLGYEQEQEKIRIEAQRKLDEEAEKERQRKQKQEDEWRAKEQANRDEYEKLLAEGNAKEAEKARLAAEKAAEKAEERAEQKEDVEAPVVAARIEKVKGLSTRKEWYAEVVDFTALPNEYKIANETMLNKMAKATKDAVKVPGVVFKSRDVMASR